MHQSASHVFGRVDASHGGAALEWTNAGVPPLVRALIDSVIAEINLALSIRWFRLRQLDQESLNGSFNSG